ncbi:MAG: response regulator transcription factor [Deltaproteobacteria bacterium]|nr:response regulator transcription factor [Deltaproteobacteria bacterium]
MNARINVVIVEDVEDVREGLKYLLGLDETINVINTYSTAEALIKDLKRAKIPDIVLMDIGLPQMNGIEATKIIKSEYPNINILMLTIFEEEDKILKSIRAGATGYILKNATPNDLIEQVKSLAVGGSPISPKAARKLLDEIKKEKEEEAKEDYNLTSREKEILKSIADGYSYKEIARKHYIADSTAKKHILNIYKKLHVKSKVEFVKKVLQESLIEDSTR